MGWAGNDRPKPRWRCPRCRSEGDPRSCACMRQVVDALERTRREIRMGHASHALSELAAATETLRLLGLDAGHARRAA
jgi:hypothetical protein